MGENVQTPPYGKGERHTVALVGAGTMGLAIARLLAAVGHELRLFDVRGITSPLGDGIVACDSLASCVEGADLVLEAIVEDLLAKQELLRKIQSLVGPLPIASNTSTFRPSQIAEGLEHPEALLVAHFFNPADIVPLVELVPGPTTSPVALSAIRTLLIGAGKVVVTLNYEIDGFIANRLQAALIREALYLLREGVASASEIDTAVTHAIGPRLALAGPFEVMDLGGLDVWTTVTGRLFPLLSNELKTPSEVRERTVAGDLGFKTGHGFYDYSPDEGSPFESLEEVLRIGQTQTEKRPQRDA
jgi:3-hydroxybutyryl-CoA dehydrogenase